MGRQTSRNHTPALHYMVLKTFRAWGVVACVLLHALPSPISVSASAFTLRRLLQPAGTASGVGTNNWGRTAATPPALFVTPSGPEDAPSSPGLLHVVVLGNSYTDSGRKWARTNHTVPSPQWYWRGRYSDGPVWPEYLSNLTAANATSQRPALQVTNLAYGGAPACHSRVALNATAPVDDLDDQINIYLANYLTSTATAAAGGAGSTNASSDIHARTPQASAAAAARSAAPAPGAGLTSSPPGAAASGAYESSAAQTNGTAAVTPVLPPPAGRVVVLEFGANDYLNELRNITEAGDLDLGLSSLPEDVVNCIQAGMRRLVSAGETHIVVMGLPAVAHMPQLATTDIPGVEEWVRDFTARHDTELRQAVANMSQAHPNVTFDFYDLGNLTAHIQENGTVYGINNTKDACLEYTSSIGSTLRDIPVLGDVLSGLSNWLDELAGSKITGKCDSPGSHFWWDKVHPTQRVHQIIANDFLGWLQNRTYYH